MSSRPGFSRRSRAAGSPCVNQSELAAIARGEDWLKPLPEIRRVVLHPWQQAVFWGLRLYIVAMLAVIGWSFWLAAS